MESTYSTKSLNRSLRQAPVALVLLLAAGCSDSETLDRVISNQPDAGTEVTGEKASELPNGGSESDGSKGQDIGTGDTGSGGNSDEGQPGGGGETGKDGNGTGDSGSVTPPTGGGDVDAGQLSYLFHRDPPKENSAEPRVNEEMVGRSFDFSVFKKAEDGFGLEDISDKVTWTAVTEQCGEVSCFKVADGNKIKGTSIGKFTLVAEYEGLSSPPIRFVTEGKLDVCPTGEKSLNGKPCLAVVEQTLDNGNTVMYTEPPRTLAMELMGYKEEKGPYNTGYSYSEFIKSSAGDEYAQMTNVGYVPGIDFERLIAGDFGQHDRYCKDLKEMEFNGRNDWRRPYMHELVLMSKDYVAGGNGWPEGEYAAANYGSGNKIAYVNMKTGQTGFRTVDEVSSPVCASGEPF